MVHGLSLLRRATTTQHGTIRAPRVARRVQSQAWQPLRPPNPAELPKPRPRKAKPPFLRRKWVRRLLFSSALLGTGYVLDTQFNASSLTRSFRTFKTGLLIGLDYKINFRAHPPFATSIEALHARNAERIFDLLRYNGGLYLKIGQAIAMQSAILPPQFQRMFAKMFDDAPQNEWHEVEKVIKEDFGGKSVEEVFGVSFTGQEGKGVMEKTARASASVAQVHWARLPDGREVAVKIQKREIARQVGWDLWAFKVVTRAYTWWFGIPVYTLVPYISERLMLETDFENEADNAEEMRRLVAGEKRLNGRVYVPKVYRELSSKRVMTAEWIEGMRLWDKEGITNRWQGGWHEGSPGAGGAKLPPIPNNTKFDPNVPEDAPKNQLFKPDRLAWRGKDGKGGLGVSLKTVMNTIVDLFSAQMFLWGVVHCDPHPGNIFIRRLPSGKPEVVLIDHGLYVRMNPKFRHQYALFWKSLMAFDNDTIKDIATSWGINSPDIFASATLMRPYTGGDNSTLNELRKESQGRDQQERAFEMQVKARDGIKQVLGDETKWPRELIFLGRNLRIVQGNNQFLGSPVNRIKITGLWASRALAESKDLTLGERWQNWVKHLRFRFVLVLSDMVFLWSRARQILGIGRGMEEDIEERMKVMAKDFGVELNHAVFEG